MKIVTPFSALLSLWSVRKSESARTVASIRFVLCTILASDKTQCPGQMLPQPSSGDVEVPGTTIHSTIPYVPHLRIEGRDRSIDAGNIEPCRCEIRVYLAWHRPCQQRVDKTKTLIIHDVTFSGPQIIFGFRQYRRELRATKHGLWRDHVLRSGMEEADSPWV